MAVQTESGERLLATLSPREQQILEHTSRGSTNAQTAVDLHISTHAVKFHLASIYRKLGVANRTEATARYVSYVSALAREDMAPRS